MSKCQPRATLPIHLCNRPPQKTRKEGWERRATHRFRRSLTSMSCVNSPSKSVRPPEGRPVGLAPLEPPAPGGGRSDWPSLAAMAAVRVVGRERGKGFILSAPPAWSKERGGRTGPLGGFEGRVGRGYGRGRGGGGRWRCGVVPGAGAGGRHDG